MQSGEMPLLFEWQAYHLWGNSYEKYYHQPGGSLFGFIPFSINLQLGQGRDSITLVILNFGLILSWNAKYGKSADDAQVQAQGPQVEMRCLCGNKATAMAPICEACAQKLVARVQ